MSRGFRRAAWLVLPVTVVVSLFLATQRDGGNGASGATSSIAQGVRCPTCRGQSVADSAAPAAQAIYAEIERRVQAGETRREIEAYLVGRYGDDILLTPPDRGLGAIVWALPVVVLAGGGAALWLALRRWAARPLRTPSDDDRRLVERMADS